MGRAVLRGGVRIIIGNIIVVITQVYAILTNGATLTPLAEPPPPWQTFEATAYVAMCDTGCTGITASGLDVRHTIYDAEGRRVIAVDPDVVPLGSTLEVRMDGGYTFAAVAEDTGGAIDGRDIDVLVPSEGRAWDFGRQAVEVRILNEKGAD